MSDEQKREKLRAFPYIIGSLSFIPIFGVVFGIISISWGLVTKKIGGKLYKTQNGYYPESLKLLKESFPKWTWLVIYDASISKDNLWTVMPTSSTEVAI